ncbi:pyridoxal phosphate-dependent aminotransferase [Halomonas shantousis]
MNPDPTYHPGKPSLDAAAWLQGGYDDAREATRASDTLLINEQSRLLETQGRRIVKFGFGQSPFPVFGPAVEALARHAGDKAYLPVQGLAALRSRVAAFQSRMDATPWEEERVMIAPGSKLLLFALMRALPPAEIVIPAPAWVSYAPQARMAGQRAVRLETSFATRWQITPEQLDAHCRAGGPRLRLLILNAPGNPTGLSMDESTQRDLADVAHRHGVLVLSDEIYAMLHHQGEHRAFARDYPHATVTTSGLSKWCGAGGWRLGVAHIPAALGDEVLARMRGIASETWSSVASPVQEAAVTAYTPTPALREYVQRQRDILRNVGEWCAAQLNQAGIRTHAPQGGFYLFPDFEAHRDRLAARDITTSAQLTSRLLEELGVALLPGSAFGCAPDQLTVRLAYVDFDGDSLMGEDAPDAGAWVDRPAFDTLRHGIQAMVDWVRG